MLVIDNSLLATNMYKLLFAGHPEWEVQYIPELATLTRWQVNPRKWRVMIVNTGVAGRDPGGLTSIFTERPGLQKIPKIFLISPGQGALKDDLSKLQETSLVQKPFFPYDLLTQLNQIIIDGKKKQKRAQA